MPHGSRKLEHLTQLNNIDLDWKELIKLPTVLLHDQEPLYPDHYGPAALQSSLPGWFANNMPAAGAVVENPELMDYLSQFNLAAVRRGFTIFDKNILVHSELNSPQVEFYQNHGFATVYWWSHAMIARDWYRYAEIDSKLQTMGVPDLDFNIYNRAWTGSREYRLKFADLVLTAGLESRSLLSFSKYDQGHYWRDHVFMNPAFRPDNDLEQLPVNMTDAWYSADYSAEDYQHTWWDVVLETIFDEPRVHLTEKILRPIACGKPFLAVAPPGSLTTLRRYGFQTFGDFVDESYDQETDNYKRLCRIIEIMQTISSWSAYKKATVCHSLKRITEYNKRRFFSQAFQDAVFQELDANFAEAVSRCRSSALGHNWSKVRALARCHPDTKAFFTGNNYARSRQDIADICQYLRGIRRQQQDPTRQEFPAVVTR